ncbi:MAG: hypothetical protein IPK82_09275 [Polyangiaceae bacterium]|nr:hypothetical protein [Polyangiaceae bacterium]
MSEGAARQKRQKESAPAQMRTPAAARSCVHNLERTQAMCTQAYAYAS